ncbi:glycosyl transferase family 25 [Agrobacterium vitis]|nr:glycosyl transferase family 25 [Agrobacterium vitis]MBE1439730.1 glycosyl transferase family 25 [Agrobacterium vitis]
MSFHAQLPVYVINLARSVDRWQAMAQSAADNQVSLIRVDAVDGRSVARQQWQDIDIKRFGRRNGRTVLPGEYGCYQSHLRALEAFVESGLPAGIILEDDVELVPEFDAKVRAILAVLPQTSLVKLVHHRAGGFLQVATTPHDVRVGACAFGPEGSSAAYALTRSAALKLLVGLKPMSLPFDVALGRGWAMDIAVYNVAHNLLRFAQDRQLPTDVGTTSDYKASKWKKWRRIPAYLFRAHENNLRIIHALRCRLFLMR